MKRILLSVFIVVLILPGAFAQRRNGLIGHRNETSGSFTLAAGPAYCFDDAIGTIYSYPAFSGHNFQFALGYLQTIDEEKKFGWRAQLHYYNFGGDDDQKMHSRGFYSYVSNVFETTARAEYGLSFGKRFRRSVPNQIYAFAGVGAFVATASFPKSSYAGKETPSLGALIPFGVGYKYKLNQEISLGVETSAQIVFSDLVDGYVGSHVPGLPVVNDNIGSLSFTFYYKLF